MEAERPRLRAARAVLEDLHRGALPGRAVDDTPVRPDPRAPDGAAPERDLPDPRGEGRRPPEHRHRRGSGGEEPERERRARQEPPRALRLRHGDGGARPAHLRDVVAHALQVAREVLRRGVTLLRVLREATLHDPAERRRDPRREPRERLRLLTDDRGERLGGRPALERAAARGHLVEHRAERELVGAEVDRLRPRLLRRHVAHGAEDGARHRARVDRRRGRLVLREASGAGQLRDPEVEDLREAVGGDHHVRGLQVAMHDPRGVRLREPLGELRREVEDPARRQRPLLEDLAERAPEDELHREVRRPVRRAHLVDGDDGRVVERGGGARLLLEAAEAVRVLRELLRQQLERDLAPEPRVLRAEDLSHPAGAEWAEDLVRAEARAWRGHHPRPTGLCGPADHRP